jgi:molybdenum cofactor cytidylyltransferase
MLSAIILAAGSSQRMGNRNKLLLPFGGKTVLETTISNILAAGIEELIVVTGNEAAQAEEAIKHLPVTVIHNPGYKKGMTSSIQEGVRNAKGKGYMICLADMVLITPEEYGLLRNSYNEQLSLDPECICIPQYNNEKGNPVIFSSRYRESILQHPEMEGCKRIVQLNKAHCHWIEMPTDHVLKDMDYYEDYLSTLSAVANPGSG